MARFIASERLTVPSGDTETLFVEHSASTTLDLVIFRISYQSNSEGYIEIHKNVTEDSAGTDLTVFNVRADGTSAPFTVNTGGTYSGRSSDPFIAMQMPSGGGGIGNKVGGNTFENNVMVLHPGENMLTEFNNDSGTSSAFSTVIRFATVQDGENIGSN